MPKKQERTYRTEKQIRKLLDQAEKQPYGKQRQWLEKKGINASHLHYWRKKYGYR